MEAYHAKTSEPSPYDPIGFEFFTLDSLLIKDASLLMGYAPHDLRRGSVLSYRCPSVYSERFEALIRGDKSVRGEIVAKMELTDDIVESIRESYDVELREFERTYHDCGEVRLSWDYQGTTRELVHILSKGYADFIGGGGRPRKKEKKWFSLNIPVLFPKPIPALS